jgi:hypothetical protein
VPSASAASTCWLVEADAGNCGTIERGWFIGLFKLL